MKLFNLNTPIAEAISAYPELIIIFERLNLPLGVQEHSIEEYAKNQKLSPAFFLSLLNLQTFHLIDEKQIINQSDAKQIIDYLKSSHDYYTQSFYPQISQLIEQLIEQNNQTEFKMLRQFFDGYRQEVEQHFNYENDYVFPYVNYLLNGKDEAHDFSNYSVDEYKQHHDDIEEKLNDLKSLLIKFLPPANDTKIRRQIIMELSALDADLEVHARIENEILIPLVEQLETEGKHE